MKILFVASGNKDVGVVSSFVRSQLESLQSKGLDMLLFPVRGHGWKAYARAIYEVRRLIKKEHPDIVHAHYSTCGIVAALAAVGLRTKVFVSILGSFPRKSCKLYRVRFFIRHIWDGTLVKSRRTMNQLRIDLPVVPNGVNMQQFVLTDKVEARRAVGFEADKLYVIFVSNPARVEKNWPLAELAFRNLGMEKAELVAVFDKTHDEVVRYMCAADVLLMTSVSEGSPNVIKEAMACNLPVVTTDVGDVCERLDGLDGCYVAADNRPETIAGLLRKALDFGGRTNGREAILSQGLTSEQVADRLKTIYEQLLSNK